MFVLTCPGNLSHQVHAPDPAQPPPALFFGIEVGVRPDVAHHLAQVRDSAGLEGRKPLGRHAPG